MSVHHSPKTGQLRSDTGGGSQPDLRTFFEKSAIKRKHPECDHKEEMESLRKQMESLQKDIKGYFADFIRLQKEDKTEIKKDLAEIKYEFINIKQITEDLSKQYQNLKEKVVNIQTENKYIQEKIDTLESTVHAINSIDKNTTGTSSNSIAAAVGRSVDNMPNTSHEALFLEIEERQRRANNLIFVGIPEITEKSFKVRQEHDVREVIKILQIIDYECSGPTKIIRLGKYSYGKDRPLRVCFQSADIVKQILRSKSKLTGSVRVYADLTLSQRHYFNSLKQKLLDRERNGEKDLILKYINGFPKIVKKVPKNSN